MLVGNCQEQAQEQEQEQVPVPKAEDSNSGREGAGGGGGGPALLWFRPFSEEPEPLQAPFGPLALTVAVAAVATEEEPKPCEGGPWGRRAAVSALT